MISHPRDQTFFARWLGRASSHWLKFLIPSVRYQYPTWTHMMDSYILQYCWWDAWICHLFSGHNSTRLYNSFSLVDRVILTNQVWRCNCFIWKQLQRQPDLPESPIETDVKLNLIGQNQPVNQGNPLYSRVQEGNTVLMQRKHACTCRKHNIHSRQLPEKHSTTTYKPHECKSI